MDPAGRITQIVENMTLDEKIAQLSCVARTPEQPWLLHSPPDTAAAELVDRHPHGIGQLGRPSQQLDPEAAARLTNAIQAALAAQTRLGIPALFNEEGLHGHVAIDATMYPAAIALASTWDVNLVERVFAAVAREVRSRGSNYVYAPVLDVARDPRWGRFEETFGEDPFLVSAMGVAAVVGLQGTAWDIPPDRVLACAKHFAGHGAPEAGMNAAPLHAGERELREEHLAPFRAVVEQTSLGAIMAAYHEIDGTPCHASSWLLTDILRGEWGFDGFVTSDGFGVPQLIDQHHVAETPGEAARLALSAGCDCEVPEGRCFSSLSDEVETGHVEMALIDRAVLRILTAKQRLGLLENTPFVEPGRARRIVNDAEHRALALEAAIRSATLLKNDGDILPLDPGNTATIAVIGPNAVDLHLGGYSRTDGPGVSVLEGIRNRFAPTQVTYSEGCQISEGPRGAAAWWVDDVHPADPAAQNERIAEARQLAGEADIAILVVGGNEMTSREGWATDHRGDRTSLDLAGAQVQLIEQVAATGTPAVAVVMGGRPLDLRPVIENCCVVLQIWYPGQEGGNALAALLAGDASPSGKLPVTLSGGVGRTPATYRDKPSKLRGYLFETDEPLFPFGHGLSYTTFEYAEAEVDPPVIAPGETATASVAVTNTGRRPGIEIVQCYVHDRVASVTRPIQSLCGFAPVQLEPGERVRVTFPVEPEAISLLDHAMKSVVEPGVFDVRIGGSSRSTIATELTVR